MMNMNSAMNEYKKAGVHAEVMEADPHRLIQMLMEGAIDRISIAKGAMQQKNVALKGERISSAISIVEGLRGSLNMEAGGDISANLESMYDYMTRRLMEANLKDDVEILDEVADLMRKIKSGWDEIPNNLEH
jgi:flagellar protein FliS